MTRLRTKLTSLTIGVAAFTGGYLFLFPTGCADVDGMSSWERCTTPVGTPAFSLTDWGVDSTFDTLIPLAVGILAAHLTQWGLANRTAD